MLNTLPASGQTARDTYVAINPIIGPLLVFSVVFAACLAGILLRPPGLLSSFWSANAILLALMVSLPRLATLSGWIAAFCAYMLPDMMEGGSYLRTLLLTSGNLAGVLAGFFLFRTLRFNDVQLERPHSVSVLLLIALFASAVAAIFGICAGVLISGLTPVEGYVYWLVTEFANYIAILPIAFVAPGLRSGISPAGDWPQHTSASTTFLRLAPLLTCAVLLIVATVIGGPGALAIPVPGLVWCALTYRVPMTALLSFIFAVWALVLPAYGVWPDLIVSGSHYDLMGLRIGVSLVALTPVVIASAMTSRAKALNEARAARRMAEDAMAARSLMIATMAHELRTPLNAMVGLATLLEMKPPHGVDKAEHRKFAGEIRQGGLHLAELVTDLLDTAKVEAGEAQLEMMQVGSRATIEQSLRLVSGIAAHAKVRFELTGEDWPDVIADPRAIKQVMINLLSNAIKFSPSRSIVVIAAQRDGERLVLSVKDSGVGISAEELAKLGRPFVQTAAGQARPQGTGLGLALSMDLICKHGGVLRLESAPGKGTMAAFDLPLA